MSEHKVLTPKTRDELSPVWDMSQERVLALTLINQRFNFLLIFFSVIVGGAINAKDSGKSALILALGTVIAWFMILAIVLAQKRLRVITMILGQDETHPYAIVTKESGQRIGIQQILSFIVAPLCGFILTVGALLALGGHSLFR